ncbi:MAG: periplasmic heavy metal sensor [bacterium]
MKKVTVGTVVLLVALYGVAMAMGPGGGGSGLSGKGMNDHRGMWWDRDQVTEELGLTPKEIDKLDKLHRDHQHRMIDLREDAGDLRRDLARYLESDSFSVSGAMEKYKAVDKNRSEMGEAMFTYRIKQREILGTERFGKLRDGMGEHRQERMGGKGRHMGR